MGLMAFQLVATDDAGRMTASEALRTLDRGNSRWEEALRSFTREASKDVTRSLKSAVETETERRLVAEAATGSAFDHIGPGV